MWCTLPSKRSKRKSMRARKMRSSNGCGRTLKRTSQRSRRPLKREVSHAHFLPKREFILSELRRAVSTALGLNRNAHGALWAIFRRGRCGGGRLGGPAIHHADEKKYSERNDQEVDDGVQKRAVA